MTGADDTEMSGLRGRLGLGLFAARRADNPHAFITMLLLQKPQSNLTSPQGRWLCSWRLFVPGQVAFTVTTFPVL